jgi:hypothetical protein
MPQILSNNTSGTVANAVAVGDLTITLTSTAGFPSLSGGNYLVVTLIGLNANNQEGNWEIVRCTAISGNVLTVVRAQEGTTAQAWGVGTRCELRATAGLFNNWLAEPTEIGSTTPNSGVFTTVRTQAAATQDAIQLQGRAGGTGGFITTLTPGTLTASNTLTLPNGTGTLATTANTTQTFSGTTTFSNTFTLSGTTHTIGLGNSLTTGTVVMGGATQTGALTVGQSTGAQTVNVHTGATTTGVTKTLNLGTGGASGSTTNINLGSATAGATSTITLNANPVIQSGTANGLLYLNASKVATSGAALTFDGAKFAITGVQSSNLFSVNASGGGDQFSATALAAGNGAVLAALNSTSADYEPLRIIGEFQQFDIRSGVGTSTEAMRLTSTGLGIGVTPSAWVGRAIEIGPSATGFLFNDSNNTNLGSNAYFNAGWKYQTSAVGASRYAQSSGGHVWYTAPSGTAGNAITFTQTATLTATGHFKATNNGLYSNNGLSATGPYHQFVNNQLGSTVLAASHVSIGTGVVYEAYADTQSQGLYFQGVAAGVATYRVQTNGNVLNTNNSYGALSDIKLKENITDCTPKLDKLMQVRVVNYNLKGSKDKQLGVIAQELEQVFPGLVEEQPDTVEVTKTREVEVPAVMGEDGEVIDSAYTTEEEYTERELTGTTTKSVKYSVFVPMLIKAMQELKAELDATKKELNDFKRKGT